MANPPALFRNRPARWMCALALCLAAAKAQTLPNLQNPLTSVSAATASNCQSGVTGCQQATLAAETNVTISYQTQVVLGPGFDAKAVDTSTSLTILPPAPGVTSVTPSSGSGSTQNFTVAASSSNWAGAGVVQILFNWATWAAGSCYAIYYQGSNLMYLLNDDASSWGNGYAPGSQASLSNSQCTLNVQNSSAPVSSGNNLSVTFSITFKPGFFGTQQTLAYVSDASGQSSGWLEEGTWTAYAAPYSQTPCTPASSCAVTPSGQTGMSAQFTFTSSDLNGAAYIPEELIFLGPNSTNSCILLVYDANNGAYLLNDASSSWTPIPAANSQCAISGTSGSNSGNNWIYNVSATFSASYAGTKPIYLQVYDHALQTNGLQQVGTWTVGTPEFITLATNPPGLAITADGTTYASPQAFSWAAGSQHTIAASSPQTTGTGAQYIFTNWSDSGAASHTINVPTSSASYTANFAPVDFTITVTPTANPSIAMAGGNGATYTVTVGSLNGFSGTVTLTAPPLPAGFTASFGANTITGAGSTTMTITAPAGSIGNIAVSATGTSGPLVHAASGGTLAVQDFTLPLSPPSSSNLTIAANTSGAWLLGPQGLNSFNQPISLAQTQYYPPPGGPSGCTVPLTLPSTVMPGQTAQVSVSLGSYAPGTYQCGITISGKYGGVTHFATGYLVITSSADFTLISPGQQTASAGASAAFTLAYQPLPGFTGTVGFSVAALPPGASASFAPLTNGASGSQMTVTVPPGILPGSYPLPITAATPAGCSGGSCNVIHGEYAWLNVSAGQAFSITANPPNQTVAPGGTAQYTVQVTGTGGTTGNVILTGASNVGTVLFNGASSAAVAVGGSASMTVAVSSGASSGSTPVRITGTLGGVPQHGAPRLDVEFPGEATEVSNVTGDQNDTAGNMIAGIPEHVTIWGSGFGDGNSEECDGYVEFSGPGAIGGTADGCGGAWQDGSITLAGTVIFSEPGVYTVTVWPSGADQAASGAFVVDSAPPLPNATSISPSTAPVGQQNLSVTIQGTDFSGTGAGPVTSVFFTIAGTPDGLMTFNVANITPTMIQGTLNIEPNAQIGTRNLAMTTGSGQTAGSGVAFTVQGDPTPVITSMSPQTIAAGAVGVPVVIAGSGFGTNPAILASGSGVSARIDPNSTPSDTQINALFDAAENADPMVNVSVDSNGTTTHNFVPSQGAQQQSNSVVMNVTPAAAGTVTIMYRAFIRGDWIQGPTNCVPGLPIHPPAGGSPLYYRGDHRNFSLSPSAPSYLPPSNPYRGMESATINLNASNPLVSPGEDTGISRQYDTQSLVPNFGTDVDPAGTGQVINPFILDSPRSCSDTSGLIQKNQAIPNWTPTATRNSDGSVSVAFSGSASNPDEPFSFAFPITWGFVVTISADGSTATVGNGSHSCYPAHEIIVNGRFLWRYGPDYAFDSNQSMTGPGALPNAADNDIGYLTNCLSPNLGPGMQSPHIPISNSISLR